MLELGRHVACALILVGFAGCATAPNVPASQTTQQGWVSRSALPADFVVGGADTPLSWTAPGESSAIVVAERMAGDKADGTMLNVSNKTGRQLKYDLYISPDGAHFQYTSTCVLIPNGTGFESWPYAIHSFAIGHVRDETSATCR